MDQGVRCVLVVSGCTKNTLLQIPEPTLPPMLGRLQQLFGRGGINNEFRMHCLFAGELGKGIALHAKLRKSGIVALYW